MKIKSIFTLLSSGLLTCYFLYSALNGQYGMFNQFKYRAQEIVLSNSLTNIKRTTYSLEKKVARLSEDNMDLDLLDQQARKLLGLAKPNELIIQIK